MTSILPAVELETAAHPDASIIWLHGLGADGNDFVPIVEQMGLPDTLRLRFVFPHAPVRPVTLNGGFPMRAWYDIVSLERRGPEDERGVRQAQQAVEALIRRENERGIASERIVLAGFSQGGAVAMYAGTRYPRSLAGIMGLSCYMLGGARFAAERMAANQHTPIFLAHGTQDPVVMPVLGEETRRALEQAPRLFAEQWRNYRVLRAVRQEDGRALICRQPLGGEAGCAQHVA